MELFIKITLILCGLEAVYPLRQDGLGRVVVPEVLKLLQDSMMHENNMRDCDVVISERSFGEHKEF